MMMPMTRKQISLVVLAVLLAVIALPAVTSARTGKPVIKDDEVGYFGSANYATNISVFVYSNMGPRQGNRVTVCYRGTCEAATGHNARLNWYQASFPSPKLAMGAPVAYKVIAKDSGGRVSTSVTKGLLCMHNDGSTPQTS
jgi:hypothetical protein